MKYFSLLFLLLLFMPTISIGAEMRTLEVEYSFTVQNGTEKLLTGYRLYKEGQQACETYAPNANSIICDILTEDGTFDFTLTAHYNDGTESPPSISFPFTIGDTKTCVSSDCTSPQIEVGEAEIADDWVTILFENTFTSPVVIAGPPTFNDPDSVLVRIRNVNETGFEVRLQEWDYQDGTHAQETFNYIVIEKGTYTLENGSKMEAGNFIASDSFSPTTLQQAYDFTPVVLTQIVTDNEIDAVTGRIRNINQKSFEFMLQEMEKSSNGHVPETIGYIAWEPGKGEVSGMLFEAGVTATNVREYWFDHIFETQFSDLPFFMGDMQTCNDIDTAAVRSNNLSTKSIQITIQEDKSKHQEVKHGYEAVGYLTFGSKAK
jgi:hypothetical protein